MKLEPVSSKKFNMGSMTDSRMESWKNPAEGGYEAARIPIELGVEILILSSKS